jgi:hypothetical protein
MLVNILVLLQPVVRFVTKVITAQVELIALLVLLGNIQLQVTAKNPTHHALPVLLECIPTAELQQRPRQEILA